MRSSNLIFTLFVLMSSCQQKGEYIEYHGEAQGTTFSIKYKDKAQRDFEEEIDSILNRMDLLFSTYVETSQISEFNKSALGVEIDPLFSDLWEKCWELNIESDGYFDPTLKPVFEAYGNMDKDVLDSGMIQKALTQTGMVLIRQEDNMLIKKDKAVRIDLNAVAQGYSADCLMEFFQEQGIRDAMIEIGGEVRVSGKNPRNKPWVIGIDKPIMGKRALMATIQLDDEAMATSGNYRKFEVIDGKSVGHIINPKTGFPSETSVLSVSVIAKDCYRADALATALMSRDRNEIVEFDQDSDDVSLLAIYLTEEGDTAVYFSEKLKIKLLD